MTFQNHARRKYLLLLPIVFLLLNAFYFRWVTDEITETLLSEKVVEKQTDLELLCAQLDRFIELDGDWDTYDYAKIMAHSLEYLDNLPHTFAALYDSSLQLLTARTHENAPFDPLAYPQFTEAVCTNETGELTLLYNATDTEAREMRVIWRWVPTDTTLDGRFLTVVAISRTAVTTPMAAWVSAGQLASILVTFALEAWLVLLLCRAGAAKPEAAK
jgi:hypothetical protein